ncbi:hypothetical protein [uncultured Aquabacterium sp.]|jgi:hypothetical protein|uniref:hypothetical protein n=1 Tax=uncultured Aquabacterium sp. TaxID=158753 RepID=UPI00262387A6|nr:hypothetical protein [uncultured Aquabacterium sp.]
MDLIVLEAAAALALLGFVVWWTMFSGRRGGELDDDGPGGPVADEDQGRGSTGPVAEPASEADAASRGGNRKLKG